MDGRDIRNRIRGLRGQLGLTQVQLAERLGVTFATVNRWENGASRPSRLALLRLAELEERVRSDASYTSGRARHVRSVKESADAYTVHQQPTQESSLLESSILDFGADPEVVRLVAEGERLSHGHLFNPSFATETSLIDPLPHQRIAVYEHMLPEPHLRFLLADDAGAGKTIMTGLYIREMLTRRLVRRVLIVPPAGLVGNWERELRTLFNLPFRILSGPESKADNPFIGPWSSLLIVSVDTLSGGRTLERFEEVGVEPCDLVVFDEAHKLSADRNPDLSVRRTERYKLAERLAPRCRHLLLLTATPHMGKDYPYFALWKLLEPDVLTMPEAFHGYPLETRARHFLRRTKEEMVYYDGRRIYPERESQTVSYDLARCGSYRPGEPCHPCEQRLYDETTNYIQTF
ncbi:MAG: helix-turn-helix domain-containing protein, partial [candidate division NC10 bacterium]|nr:helix-turn-helix domain-containing protein [candidate division NC10 bacterium]